MARRVFRDACALAVVAALSILLEACPSTPPQRNEVAGEGAENGKTGVCRAQIEDYVSDNFQQTVSRIDFDYVFDQRSSGQDGDGPTSAAVVYTEECPGYHVFDVFGSDYECEASVHYGEVRNYVRYRVSELGC